MIQRDENSLGTDLEHELDHPGHFWEVTCGTRIFLTGGTGFFGKSLLSYFSENNLGIKKLIVLSRHPEKLNNIIKTNSFPFEIEYIKQDIRKPIKFNQPVDYLIHAAAESSTSIGMNKPMLMRDVVVQGTKNVLEYARMQRVKRVLFISSGAVYGKQPSGLNHLHEECESAPDPLNPLNAYGCAKRQAENLCALYHHHYGIDYVVARCFAFVGPYLPLDAHYAIGNFIRDGLRGGPIVVKGDGITIRSYLYADDLAEWLWTILLKGNIGKAYNVGSDQAIAIDDLARLVSNFFDDKLEVINKGKPDDKFDRYLPKVEKIKNELGVLERVALADGIKRTIAFHSRK